MLNTSLYLYSNIKNEDIFVGTLYLSENKDNFEFSFQYADDWLGSEYAYPLSIDLPLSKELFKQNMLFNVFVKQCFMSRVSFYLKYLALYLKKQGLLNNIEVVSNKDVYAFLTGDSELRLRLGRKSDVFLLCSSRIIYQNDLLRSGSFRFKREKDGDFIQKFSDYDIPTENDLPRIIEVIRKINEQNETIEDFNYFNSIVAGLDGGKPKVSIIDSEGDLCIVKFSQYYNTDSIDIYREILAIHLAQKFGITTQGVSVGVISNKISCLKVKRFDRKKGERLQFAVLGSFTNSAFFDDADEQINAVKILCGKTVENNLRELFKRKLFRLVISNTDDFVNNVGFLFDNESKTWNFAPDYDVLVGYDADRDKEFIINNEQDEVIYLAENISNFIKDYKQYCLSRVDVIELIDLLKSVLQNWKDDAIKLGFSEENLYRVRIYPKVLDLLKF